MEIINWVTGNWGTLINLYLASIGVASIVVKLTPTLKDDAILKGVIRFVGRFLAINRK